MIEKVNNNRNLDEGERQKIDDFLSRKRKDVMNALYPDKRVSHKELAKKVSTSTASLSNILWKFENFDYQLLDSESEGRNRYYFLSDLGREYMDAYRREEEAVEKGKIIYRESAQTMHQIKEFLKEFQCLYGDEWEMALEDGLLARIECKSVPQDEGVKVLDNFIDCVEKVLIYDYDNNIVELMKLLSGNSILQGRFSRFIEKFDLFRPVLEVYENELDAFQMYELLETALKKEKDKAKRYIEGLHWTDEYEKLCEGIGYIAECTAGKSKQHIYECLKRYLAGNGAVSAFLAREIFDNNKRTKESDYVE